MPTKIFYSIFGRKTKTKVTCASIIERSYGSVANFNIFDATQMTFFLNEKKENKNENSFSAENERKPKMSK